MLHTLRERLALFIAPSLREAVDFHRRLNQSALPLYAWLNPDYTNGTAVGNVVVTHTTPKATP